MLRDIFGAIVFTAAVLAFVNFVGDIAIQPQTQSESTASAPEEAEPVAEAAPVPEPMPTPQPAAQPVPTEPMAAKVEAAVTPALAPKAPTTSAGDAAKGKNIFRKKCMTCHTIDKGGKARTGPNLWAIIDRPKGAAENFRYSNTLKHMGGVWSEADIMSFIAGPRTFVADTKMTFAGLKKESDRANVMAFLRTLMD